MNKIQAGKTISSNAIESFSLYKKSSFGEPVGEKIQYSLPEALFLTEKGKMEVFHQNKKIVLKDLMKKITNMDRRISVKYPVFKNLREKG